MIINLPLSQLLYLFLQHTFPQKHSFFISPKSWHWKNISPHNGCAFIWAPSDTSHRPVFPIQCWGKDTRRMWPMCSETPQHEWAVKHEHDSLVGSGVAGRTGLRKGEERKNNCRAWRAQNSRVLRKTQMKSLVCLPQLSGACNNFKSHNGNTKL